MKNTRRIESLSELLDEINKIEVICNFVKEENRFIEDNEILIMN